MIPTSTPYPVLPSPELPVAELSVGLVGLVVLLTLIGLAVAWLRRGADSTSPGGSHDE